MSTTKKDTDKVPQDNVTSTPTVTVTKTQPEGTRKAGGRRVMTVRNSLGKRGAESVRRFKEKRAAEIAAKKLKKSPTTTKPSPPIIHPTSGRVVRTNSMKRENPPTTGGKKKIKGGGRSGMTARHSIGPRGPRKSPSSPTSRYSHNSSVESEMYRPWNNEEENQIINNVDSKYSMDNFFSEEETSAGCKWDYSVLVSDLPSSNTEDNDSNKNSKTDKKST